MAAEVIDPALLPQDGVDYPMSVDYCDNCSMPFEVNVLENSIKKDSAYGTVLASLSFLVFLDMILAPKEGFGLGFLPYELDGVNNLSHFSPQNSIIAPLGPKHPNNFCRLWPVGQLLGLITNSLILAKFVCCNL